LFIDNVVTMRHNQSVAWMLILCKYANYARIIYTMLLVCDWWRVNQNKSYNALL